MTVVGKKILIIEDDTPIQSALEAKFKLEGFDVTTAGNGEAGLQAALKTHPDVILLDVVMPKMDGLTMLRILRQDPWGKTAKVIFLTNLSNPETITEALGEKVFDYLVKSDWKIDAVVNKVRFLLDIPQPKQ